MKKKSIVAVFAAASCLAFTGLALAGKASDGDEWLKCHDQCSKSFTHPEKGECYQLCNAAQRDRLDYEALSFAEKFQLAWKETGKAMDLRWKVFLEHISGPKK